MEKQLKALLSAVLVIYLLQENSVGIYPQELHVIDVINMPTLMIEISRILEGWMIWIAGL
jgi:hypothetical protein